MKILYEVLLPALVVQCECGTSQMVLKQDSTVTCEECSKEVSILELVLDSELNISPHEEEGDEKCVV